MAQGAETRIKEETVSKRYVGALGAAMVLAGVGWGISIVPTIIGIMIGATNVRRLRR